MKNDKLMADSVGTYDEMTNEEYQEGLNRMFGMLEDNRLLRYFYIFVAEKLKRVP